MTIEEIQAELNKMPAALSAAGWVMPDAHLSLHANARMYVFLKGDRHTLKGSRPPHKPDSTGRVYTDRGEFYPSVIDLTFVEDAPAEDDTPDHIVDAINADLLRKA